MTVGFKPFYFLSLFLLRLSKIILTPKALKKSRNSLTQRTLVHTVHSTYQLFYLLDANIETRSNKTEKQINPGRPRTLIGLK